jgi:hypothetical protein
MAINSASAIKVLPQRNITRSFGFLAAASNPERGRSLIKIKETRLPLVAAQEQHLDQVEVDISRATGSLIVESVPPQFSAEIRQCCALAMMRSFAR